MKTLISTDTSCLVRNDALKKYDISLFPLNVIVDGEEFLDGITINQEQLKLDMRSGKNIKTSTPPLGTIIEYFEGLFEKGYEHIIHFTISSKLSSMYDLFCNVAKQNFEGKITVINSSSVSAVMLSQVFYAYEEGDDAFYIAISTITQDADTMYRKLPYTGGFTGLDVRHSLAPFPIWIAYLARMSGMPAVSVAQIILPLSLIGMAYAIYYLIAARLFKGQENRIPIFMIFVELLVLFGGYSVYTVENFLLVRASQGKAVIANIILPVLFYLLMLIMDKLQENEKVSVKIWFLMTFTCMAGCLCTTLGTILTCMLVGCGGLVGAVCYRKPKILVPMAMSCIIPVGIALLYFLVH